MMHIDDAIKHLQDALMALLKHKAMPDPMPDPVMPVPMPAPSHMPAEDPHDHDADELNAEELGNV